jgi:S-adenosylmethionine:tRNA ribosyltransferase-isomerase
MREHDPIAIADDVPTEFRLDSYRYHLPEERIARRPAERRDASRLLVLDRGAETQPAAFADLPEILSAKFPEGGLIVANNSRVFPARVFGNRATGGRVEMLVLSPLPLLHVKRDADDLQTAEAEVLLRSAKRMKTGEAADFGEGLTAALLERGEFGRCRVLLKWRGSILDIMNKIGHMPLPPYLAREDDASDRERYQTTYADAAKTGSVAAPTAGLHFTPEVRQHLREKGFDWTEVTLYVGYGTFSPVREGDIRAHEMHAEYVEVPEATAQAVQRAKGQGRPVIAIGTTSARSLEGMHQTLGRVDAFAGETKIYIIPGSRFHVVDALLTNFHLPESSLLIMVSALAGRERIMAAYAMALDRGFRFFSYGDAMLIV